MPIDALQLAAQRLAPLILLAYMLFICLEISIDYFAKKGLYSLDDTIHNLVMFFVNRMTGGIGGAFMLAVFTLAQHIQPFKLSGPFAGLITFLIVDFIFYVQHRSFHTDTLLSPFHEIHHTSNKYNLSTTLRASVLLPWVNPLFYFPAILLGCDSLAVILCFSAIQVYQFFLHTELVPSLGFLEGIINTPSAHRVHHGREMEQYESNLGGILLIWDRIFKTYIAEPADLRYGIKGVKVDNNFVTAQLRPFYNYIKRKYKQKGADLI